MDEETAPLNGMKPFLKPTLRVCNQCAFSVKEDRDLVCRLNPPSVGFVAVPATQPAILGRPAQHGIQIQTMTQFPVVREDQWCGQFEKRD